MIFNKIHCAEKNARSVKLQIGNKEVFTPIYFPSVSSVNTNHNVSSLAKSIIHINYPFMLISAFDFFHNYQSNPELIQLMNSYSKNGNVLFADSGGFESYWHNNREWDFGTYKRTIKSINCDIYSSYDPTLDIPETKSDAELLNLIISSATIHESSQFMPIFHARNPLGLVANVKEFLRRHPYATRFIAIPERECGLSLSERAETILKLRQEIDSGGNRQILHILGCGNPLSMALYCYCGADSFDSRDWMRFTFDNKSLSLVDFAHLELLNCSCRICSAYRHPYGKVFLHNLVMYSSHIKNLRELIKDDKLLAFLKEKVGQKIIDKLNESS